MKTDPTPTITGAAGMPLSYEAIESGRTKMSRSKSTSKPNTAISDTLETTDREADGRQSLQTTTEQKPSPQPESSTEHRGGQLDLIG